MGKKSGKAKPKACATEEPVNQAKTTTGIGATATATAPADRHADWKDELTDAQREAEEKKAADRQRKAEEAARQQRWANEKREQWERQEAKQTRQKDRETRQWEVQLSKAKQRAFAEGVKEAEDWGDGVWWVKLDCGNWKEAKGQYYCTICDKHLQDSSLEAHIDSDDHKKRVAWGKPPSQPPHDTGMPKASFPGAAASQAPQEPAAPPRVEEWQQLQSDGSMRCIPCGKVIDPAHVETMDHKNRLERWREQRQLETSGYPAPREPYLAWVGSKDDPQAERWLKCLLCNKFVNDETSHSDTGGSKEHQKNLRNYGPGDAWYKENVTKIRNIWHPQPVRHIVPAQPAAPTRAPWAKAAAPTMAPWAESASQAPQTPIIEEC